MCGSLENSHKFGELRRFGHWTRQVTEPWFLNGVDSSSQRTFNNVRRYFSLFLNCAEKSAICISWVGTRVADEHSRCTEQAHSKDGLSILPPLRYYVVAESCYAVSHLKAKDVDEYLQGFVCLLPERTGEVIFPSTFNTP